MSKGPVFNNSKNIELRKAIQLTKAPETWNETSKETELPSPNGKAHDVQHTNNKLDVNENQHQLESIECLKAQPRKWVSNLKPKSMVVDDETAQHMSSSECLSKLQSSNNAIISQCKLAANVPRSVSQNVREDVILSKRQVSQSETEEDCGILTSNNSKFSLESLHAWNLPHRRLSRDITHPHRQK